MNSWIIGRCDHLRQLAGSTGTFLEGEKCLNKFTPFGDFQCFNQSAVMTTTLVIRQGHRILPKRIEFTLRLICPCCS